MTTDQPILQQPIDNNILRLLIREAVEREVTNIVAPLRTAQQVQDGKLNQFNRDVTQALLQLGDLDELVRGNPKQNLIGLAEQIARQNVLITETDRKLTQAIDNISSKLGAKIDAIATKQDEATKQREALVNQWRGAKYVLGGLTIITGVSQYKALADLLTSIFT